MDIKKIGVIMLGIVMVCLVIGAVYIESDIGDGVKVRYVIENDNFSYDDETLIINNEIIEDAEDVNINENIVEYTVDSEPETNPITPILLICILMISVFMFFIILD